MEKKIYHNMSEEKIQIFREAKKCQYNNEKNSFSIII